MYMFRYRITRISNKSVFVLCRTLGDIYSTVGAESGALTWNSLLGGFCRVSLSFIPLSR